jgi:RNA polymerase sigma factor (sigma-70 family)
MESNRPSSTSSHQDSNNPGALSTEKIGTSENILSLSIIDRNSYSGKISGGVLYAFIRRQLQRYQLSGGYSENDILHEAYIRCRKAIDHGIEVKNQQAWLRGCSINIIREILRKEQKTVNIENYESYSDAAPSALDALEFREEIAILQRELQGLKQIDKILLDLKVVKGYSWEQISHILEEQGYGSFQVVSLRKRKARALAALKLSLTNEDEKPNC